MSVLADERVVITGASVTGSGTTYTLSSVQRLRLETLTFTYTASGATATRYPVVYFFSQDGSVVAQIEDANDVTAGMTVNYTYGIGLVPFCGTALAGFNIQNALPDTWLAPESYIQLTSLDSSGVTVAGDTFTSVVLYGISDTGDNAPDVIPQLTPLASAQDAA